MLHEPGMVLCAVGCAVLGGAVSYAMFSHGLARQVRAARALWLKDRASFERVCVVIARELDEHGERLNRHSDAHEAFFELAWECAEGVERLSDESARATNLLAGHGEALRRLANVADAHEASIQATSSALAARVRGVFTRKGTVN